VPWPITKSRTPNFAGWERTAFSRSDVMYPQGWIGSADAAETSRVGADALSPAVCAAFAAGGSCRRPARQVFTVE